MVQYQGSKRLLAPSIFSYFPKKFNRFIEPFSGTAAMSIYIANCGFKGDIIINDINKQIVNLLECCIESPEELSSIYEEIWSGQFMEGENNVDYYYKQREKFNLLKDDPNPGLTLFILARVAKGAIRYNKQGEMNQICDRRRNGTLPKTIRKNALAISNLLQGRCHLYNRDYSEIIAMAEPGDLIYMDPPYQGVSEGISSRYIRSLDYDNFVMSLEELNRRNVDYIVSYDGHNEETKFGKDLPLHLNLKHIHLNAGRSAQGNLNGKSLTTFESLYISNSIKEG
ncbi:DNA adenine methylase [Streptococcus suis]|uniref:DNA adenine methylase n=1 Tax=Streptococcus suis TaxID=1307 RepID=UPI001374AF3E|nr:DNA adenine methylase [Streptococcus suis]